MDLNLKGKRALVCGSTQGIGEASAIELASLGADVTLIARNKSKLDSLRERLPNEGQNHHTIEADFQEPEMLKDKVNLYLGEGNQAHILINNTGGPPGGPIIQAEYEDFLKAFDAHLHCSHILVKALLDDMKAVKFGRIVNIISTSVKIPIPGLGVSNTTRGAMANWSKTLSIELAPFGITVNNVLPGFTKTGRLDSIIQTKADKSKTKFDEVEKTMMESVPAGRFGKSSEVAALVAFLASPAAGYISGTSIPVDGARTGAL